MSLEFLQFRMPCSECIIQAICKDKHHKSVELSKLTHLCLALPDWDPEKKMYVKGLAECWANLGFDIVKALRRAKLDNRRIEMGEVDISKLAIVPNQYIDFLIELAHTIQWIVNSTSWRVGELNGFDSFEVKDKMKNISSWLDKD